MSRRDPAWDPAAASAAGLPKATWGSGAYVYDSQGRRYLDGSGGPAVFCLGHAHPEVNAAIERQLHRIAHGYRYSFTSDPLEELEHLLASQCGPRYNTTVFVSGGSEAVESALKLALQFHSARGEPSRRRFISRRRSWHGNTLGALSVSDFQARREPFEGALVPASFLGSVNLYRPPLGIAADELVAHAASELESEIERLGAAHVAGFIFEPIVGAAGCVIPPPAGYAQAIQAVCRRHGILLIADEVMCGSGRTGTWRALEQEDVEADIFAVAKGLARLAPLRLEAQRGRAVRHELACGRGVRRWARASERGQRCATMLRMRAAHARLHAARPLGPRARGARGAACSPLVSGAFL